MAGVATFLARLEALDNGSDPAHADFVAEDAKWSPCSLRGVSQRPGASASTRSSKLALGPTDALEALPTDDDPDERLAELAELEGWHEEWPPPRAPW